MRIDHCGAGATRGEPGLAENTLQASQWGKCVPTQLVTGVVPWGTHCQPCRHPLPHAAASPSFGGSKAGEGFARVSALSRAKLAVVGLGKAGAFWQAPRWECCFAGVGTTESPLR